MKITKLGEFGLIERIKKWVKNSPEVFKGIGDDCAVLKFDRTRYMLYCCDMLIENVDFTYRARPYLIGRKAVGSSISDIAAKGGIPKYALVALGIPKDKSYKFIRDLYRGINYWAKRYKIDIVGGDISRSERLVIDISMIGLVEKKNLILRGGAKINDIIFLTGKLGDLGSKKQFYFKPCLEEARYLVRNYRINSMIDISDGLALDLSHILKESNVGAVIYEKLIPVSKSGCEIKTALSKGEEFELLFSVAPKEAKRLINAKKKIYTAIGQIVDRRYGFRLITQDGKEKTLRPQGFLHF